MNLKKKWLGWFAAALFIITVFGTGRASLDGVLTRG